jgi:HPt (histidine-containing phosphotransfer) domain-containing protein
MIEGWGAPTDSDDTDEASPVPIDIAAFSGQLREAGIDHALGALLATFAGDAPARVAAIENASRDGDAAAIATSAHAFKSAAGAVSAKPLAAMLGRIELAARAGNIDEACTLAAAIRQEATAVLDVIAGLRAEVGV